MEELRGNNREDLLDKYTEEDLNKFTIDELYTKVPFKLVVEDPKHIKIVTKRDLECRLDRFPDRILLSVGDRTFELEIDTVTLFDYEMSQEYLDKVHEFKEDVYRYINSSYNILIRKYYKDFKYDVDKMFNIILDNCKITIEEHKV